MTWLKVADEFPRECRKARLSDAAFRTHTEALCYCMDYENGGVIDNDDVRSFAHSREYASAVDELLHTGFWVAEGDGYRVVHHMEHQPDRETLEAKRKADAARQQRRRRKAAGLDTPTPDPTGKKTSRRDTPRDDTRDTPRDDTRDPVRSGSVRSGEGQEQNLALEEKGEGRTCPHGEVPGWCADPACEEVTSWPWTQTA